LAYYFGDFCFSQTPHCLSALLSLVVAVLTFYLCGVVTRFALLIIPSQKPLQRFVIYPEKTVALF
jgi:hypothetical protein